MQGLPPGRAGSPGLRHNPWAPLAAVWGRLRIRAGRAFTKEGTLDAEGFLSMVWMLPVGAKGEVGEVSPHRPPGRLCGPQPASPCSCSWPWEGPS